MKIVLTGVETNNKGAELMLYAILQEVERRHPNADVYIEPEMNMQGLDYVHTKVKLRYWPKAEFVQNMHLKGIFYRLHLPMKVLRDTSAVKADYVLDGSGFCFSDQCKMWGRKAEWWKSLLKRQYDHGAKIVFLPQAFGPLEEKDTREAISVLNKYSTLIMPREKVSYDYLTNSGLVDMKKVKTFTDFTSLVDGVFPNQYERLKGGICIIPNMKMIDQNKISLENYISLLSEIASLGVKCGRPVYMLNHEGERDEKLAYICKEHMGDSIEVVSDLDALRVKGLIASAYIVVTSRFHGLASSLNSCVPSLATSWSHKYSELFHDYGMDDSYVLPLNDNTAAVQRVSELMTDSKNAEIRRALEVKKKEIQSQTKDMWECVWNV